MKTKQLVGIIVACAIFVFVGVIGLASNYLYQGAISETEKKAESLFSLGDNSTDLSLPTEDYVAVVHLEGEMSETASTDTWGNATGYQHAKTLSYIDQVMKDSNNSAILLYVDTPGGTVYSADELYLKLMEYKETTNRPVWVQMASTACSGGYYASMAADKIFANRNTMTGSIGVIIGTMNYSELLDKIGVKEIYITSGKNKAMGAGGVEMTDEQRAIYQSIIDEAYEQFVTVVARGRSLDKATVTKLADGRVYTAKQALDSKLIDSISDYATTKSTMADTLGKKSITFYDPNLTETNMLSSLFSGISSLRQKSDAEVVSDKLSEQKSGVPMYYAE